MPDFGIVPEGFLLPSLRDILQKTEDDQHATISPGLDVSEASPDGMRNAIYARQDAAVWELGAAVYEILDPDKAEGVSLVNVCKITGTVPQAATFTTVPCDVTGDIGTVLATDQVFAALDTNPETRATPVSTFTFPSAGTFTITFRAELAGPVSLPATHLTQISVGPAVGTWSAVNNVRDGALGELADDEPKLRLRRASELAAAGSSSVNALQTDIAQAKNALGGPLVLYVRVFENDTDATDSAGRPRHSIETLVVPNGTTVAGELGLFMWTRKGGGPTAFGLNSDPFTDPLTGEARAMGYTLSSALNIYVRVHMSVDATYGGDALFKQTLADTLNKGALPGATLAKIWDAQLATKQPGVTNVSLVEQGLTTSPTGTVDIAIGTRARAVYDSTRIQLVIT